MINRKRGKKQINKQKQLENILEVKKEMIHGKRKKKGRKYQLR